ncbi:MAG: iolB [Microbacteriaceae bacterium]|nr:iolB [Microbacteriaceae bacterium]HEV7956373.1 5-deoxy-glucuronate isomerase [Marisediminicola sp.]
MSTRTDNWDVSITPEEAGWDFSGIRVLSLAAGESTTFSTEDCEYLFVPFEGAFTVTVDGQLIALSGRPSVFSGGTDVMYAPKGSSVRIESADGGRICLPFARARQRHPLQYLAKAAIPTQLRGAGSMTRKIFDFGGVDVLQADRLIACEVITPGGNWSSYPPHKHDETTEHESKLEEIYYFEVADGPNGPGFAYQRVSDSDDRPADLLEEVRSGDVVLVPHGWHGPAMAPPGYDLYYLNVMAGPAAERAWRITDEPSTAWVRESWVGLAPDPRLTTG